VSAAGPPITVILTRRCASLLCPVGVCGSARVPLIFARADTVSSTAGLPYPQPADTQRAYPPTVNKCQKRRRATAIRSQYRRSLLDHLVGAG
jgi:hypothetical protein